MDTGLKFLVSGGLATSSVIRKVSAVSSLDSSLPSSSILSAIHGSWTSAISHDCSKIAKVATVIGIGYLGVRIGAAWCRRTPGIANSIITYGEEVVEQVKVDIDEDAEEESDTGEEIVVGTIGIGIHTNVNPEVRAKRRHRSRPFIKKIVNLTKNHFGGCPDSSKSNVMAVSKFVYEQCKQHNCLPHQTRLIMSVAVPLVLSPDMYDISSKALLNSEILTENRATLDRLKTLDGWLSHLVCHPLSAKAWRRAIDNLCGLPDWKAFKLVN
nr:p28k-polymerase [Melon necrotic spot virus]BAF47100.1 p28k-polymerase [Melon necrotic spot virus]